MGLFSKAFKGKDASKKTAAPIANGTTSAKPQWVDSWARTRIDAEEVAELLHGCTQEMKSRALDIPLLLLPFRPSSDPSAARTFVRNFFLPQGDRPKLTGESLLRELRMTEIMVLISVMKWCWARLPGGIVSWETYQMFKVGEKDSNYAREAFTNFIPISVDSDARNGIITDFFDLLASLAAHGKSNGLGGYKLSRYAGWWAFEHYDSGKGFESGYKSWRSAADATSHLFFAYLRSLAPEPGKTNGILGLPRSLQQLVAATSYPPPSTVISNDATKVVMVVDVVSPTPYALLRRAKNFEYRDDDRALQDFANNEDPVAILTDECQRVLKAISTTNQSNVSDAKTSTSLVDPSWSRFEDIGFSSALNEIGEEDSDLPFSHHSGSMTPGLKVAAPKSNPVNLDRPMTPSWAEFLSTGFTEEDKAVAPILLPPDKILPPVIPARGQSSQSHRRDVDAASTLEPGELASITKIAVDDAFWWVWISSLAGEEPTSRKAVFGRCAYVETTVTGGEWMILEEQVKGAAPEPVQGAYIAEKKGFLGFSRKSRLTRRRSGIKKSPLSPEGAKTETASARTSLAPDQEARIHQAALEYKKKKAEATGVSGSKARTNENESNRHSTYTLGPLMKDEASPAMQWAKQYDKNAIRTQYLGNELAGKGSNDFLSVSQTDQAASKSPATSLTSKDRDLPPVPEAQPAPAEPTARVSSPIVDRADDVSTPQIKDPSVASAHGPSPVASPGAEDSIGLMDVPEVSKPTADSPTTPVASAGRSAGPPAASRGANIKRIFGTLRKNKDEENMAARPAPEPNAAVAAARRALEGKANTPVRTSSSDMTLTGPGQTDAKVKHRVAALSQPPIDNGNTAPATESVSEPTATQTGVEPSVEPEVPIAPVHHTTTLEPTTGDPSPPRTRRDEEFDRLSRVDTREREQADHEFSRFDQGPETEQERASVKDEYEDESLVRAKHQSVYSAITMNTDATDEEDQPENQKNMTANDRWAQIRKNAADRAARTSEDQGTRSRTETRTDDGETSGEETIESRVARIKARVAELTGNMEQVRH